MQYLRVVYGHAERTVKHLADYNRSVTMKEGTRHLLFTVKNHRKSFLDDKMSTLIARHEKQRDLIQLFQRIYLVEILVFLPHFA